jgi:hypothetical protein
MSMLLETKKTADTLTISFPVKNMAAEEIQRILAFIKTELLVRKSRMTQQQANEIADAMTASWWQKNKSRIEKLVAENERPALRNQASLAVENGDSIKPRA